MVYATAAFALVTVFSTYQYHENILEENAQETIDRPIINLTLPVIPLIILGINQVLSLHITHQATFLYIFLYHTLIQNYYLNQFLSL